MSFFLQKTVRCVLVNIKDVAASEAEGRLHKAARDILFYYYGMGMTVMTAWQGL